MRCKSFDIYVMYHTTYTNILSNHINYIQSCQSSHHSQKYIINYIQSCQTSSIISFIINYIQSCQSSSNISSLSQPISSKHIHLTLYQLKWVSFVCICNRPCPFCAFVVISSFLNNKKNHCD